MEPPGPAAGWYRDPQRAGLRYWDGWQWTEHVADYQPQPPSSPRRLSRGQRVAAGIGGLLLVLLAVPAILDGNAQGWEDGSFALVSYAMGLGMGGVGAWLCWKALR